MTKTYNFIFRDLVRDENDLVGLIAYGLYKQHKIEFIESFKSANTGQDPTDEDYKAFAMTSCTPSSLKHYRDTAESLLQQITLTAAREEINAFEDDMLRQYRSEISLALQTGKDDTLRDLGEAIKRHQPKWWSSVIASFVGAVVFSLFVSLGVYLGSTSEKSNVKIISDAIETLKNINQTDSVSPADTALHDNE